MVKRVNGTAKSFGVHPQVFEQHYPLDDDPGVAPPPNPPNPAVEVTPFAVAETDEAVIEPLVTFVPWTVTVSPGFSPLREEVASRVTVAEELKVTLTRLPLALVT